MHIGASRPFAELAGRDGQLDHIETVDSGAEDRGPHRMLMNVRRLVLDPQEAPLILVEIENAAKP